MNVHILSAADKGRSFTEGTPIPVSARRWIQSAFLKASSDTKSNAPAPAVAATANTTLASGGSAASTTDRWVLTSDYTIPLPPGMTLYDPRIGLWMDYRLNRPFETGDAVVDDSGRLQLSERALARAKSVPPDHKWAAQPPVCSLHGKALRRPATTNPLRDLWPPEIVFEMQRDLAPLLRDTRGTDFDKLSASPASSPPTPSTPKLCLYKTASVCNGNPSGKCSYAKGGAVCKPCCLHHHSAKNCSQHSK